MATKIDGKHTATQIKQEIADVVTRRVAEGHKKPHLAAVLVGDNPASETYVANKIKSCQEVGFESTLVRLPKTASQEELLQAIHGLNTDESVDGFIVQLPLPSQINEEDILEAIDPNKDVDGFHPSNVGRMVSGLPTFIPATPNGIIELLKRYDIETSGKHCVVIGRSNIVGRPASILMSQKGMDTTVTVAHSRTQHLKELCLEADIVIVAIGIPQFLKGDMVKPGAVVIDVGINRIPSETTKSGWRLVGDVDFDAVESLCSYITPVPGGVGPMTIASLLQNTLKAAERN